MTKRVRTTDGGDGLSLYDMPRELLVKMICTIEQDARAPLLREIESLRKKYRKISKVAKNHGGIYNGDCAFLGCPAYSAWSEIDVYYMRNCENMTWCKWCKAWVCDAHYTPIPDSPFEVVCHECDRLAENEEGEEKNDQEGPP